MIQPQPFLISFLCIFFLLNPAEATSPGLAFESFLSEYNQKNPDLLGAQRRLARAEQDREAGEDLYQSRLDTSNELSFVEQQFDTGFQNNNTRTNSMGASLSQSLPSGTNLEVNGQKFFELQNAFGRAIDRRYSARITQDLFRNAFGRTQRANRNRLRKDFDVSQLQYKRSFVDSCEQAFTLFSNAYVQQEIAAVLKAQFADAKKAVGISRKLYRDRLINRVDKLASESDFIDIQIQYDQAEQELYNNRLEIQAFLGDKFPVEFQLYSPESFLINKVIPAGEKTLNEIIIKQQMESSEYDLERARTDRWTDVQLGLEAGESFGRANFAGSPTGFTEEYLTASVSFGFDLVNNTEDADLRRTMYNRVSLAKEKIVVERTQHNRVESLKATNRLLKLQVKQSETQVELLKEKMQLAFQQMRRAKLEFQTYLLHRNAYLNQKRNYLNLQQDLWLNTFALQKEFAHKIPRLCEVNS